MYEVGNKFFNTRKSSILTITDRMYEVNEFFSEYRYQVTGSRTGLSVWIDEWKLHTYLGTKQLIMITDRVTPIQQIEKHKFI